MNTEQTWILFSYRVPSDPSTLRVRIWRTLKSLGVLYIQQSVCLAPSTLEVKKKFNQMQKLVDDNNGEFLLLEIEKLSGYSNEQIIQKMNEQRSSEYQELMDGCRTFLKEMEKETSKGNFNFHEVEENEADLLKLKRWYKKINKRDFFNCSVCSEAKKDLDQCEQTLNNFTLEVYRKEGQREGDLLE